MNYDNKPGAKPGPEGLKRAVEAVKYLADQPIPPPIPVPVFPPGQTPKWFKKRVRARMEETGETYSTARAALLWEMFPEARVRGT